MSRAMEVVPVFSESEDGQQQLQDFQINEAHLGGEVQQRVVIDDYGNASYEQYEEESFTEEEPSGLDEYSDAVVAAYPELPNALQWATTNLDPEQSQQFNEAVATGDPSEFMPLIEALMEDYYEANGLDEEDYEEEETEDDVDDVTEEELGLVFTEMSEVEPQGQEAAMPYLQAAIDSQGSNPLYSDWMALTAQFHNSEISYEQAWEQMTDKYSLPQLKQMYNYINQQ
ncbi:hypothetical protein OAE23_01490 [Synechococcus sp. AH-551-E11]|nr:hypothetical protein [Synechococcus sp. AH-551-E11]MDB4616756.1 hypothetical protein [Synechococcus sp. AH-551-E11]